MFAPGMLFKVAIVVFVADFALGQQQIFRDGTSLHGGAAKRVITPQLAELTEKIMRDYNMSGLTLGVVHSNDTVEYGAFGRKTEDNDEMTSDTLFDMASCSKAFLAGAVGILLDDFAQGKNRAPLPSGVQKLDWHTKLVDLLPNDWQLMDEWASRKATIRDILSHQSGLPRHEVSYHADQKPVDVIRQLRHLRPAFELRQRWHYNNQFYMTGAHIISTFSGMSYMEFVKERIFDPLGMTASTFDPEEASRGGKLTQTWTADGRRLPVWFTGNAVELIAGAGGVISSVVDMTKWVRMLLNAGVDPVTNKTIIPREALDTITASHALVLTRPTASWFSVVTYGMGWSMMSYQGHNIWSHNGGLPGVSTQVFFLPDSGLGLVMLCNGSDKHKYELVIIHRIIEDFLGLEPKHSESLLASFRTSEAQQLESQDSSEGLATPSVPLSLPLDHYTGAYYDPGYGNFTFCAPSANPPEACADVLRTWSFFEDTTDATRPVLYTAISSLWVTHLRLEHKRGDTFALSGTYLFPHGYGADKSPFRFQDSEAQATAEFMIEDAGDGPKVLGVALNGFVGETTELQRIGRTIEEMAEVWLAKT
ncbi:beta-lactamase/transpeptidase-like protein [Phanerochaete sordida]|uniref:Beta-lactamase/transpeptidase-like protein n=1 Tax=Phanerochaete sordida TaxID=48140 RepID=A0A9P3GID3_9APHY|nr:beta-lactamase/transpeptidase-like protein [Phanerochaete sordida]